MCDPAIRERIASASGWHVQRQLGRGQYGTAYLVENGPKPSGAPAEQAVAKVVGLEFLPEKEHKLAFQEVEMMRNLRHPHIVALRDHFLTEGSLELVIVMEFCDCGDLRGEVKKRASVKPPDHIPEAQIMTWFVQLTLALNYMHQRHVLHRDLKSSNIFLTANQSDGRDVRIGDFGIARVLEGTVDVAATVVGTPYYMSPEVCKSEAYGFKSDIWALGCVLYEMCMLKHAFESASLLGLVYKIVSEAYDPIPSQYSADLRKLIDRVLDKSHYTRPGGKELVADPYVRMFDKVSTSSAMAATVVDVTPQSGSAVAPGFQLHQPPPRTTLASMKSSMPQRERGSVGPAPQMRAVEPTPAPPATDVGAQGAFGKAAFEDQPVRRQWCAPPFVASTKPMDEDELRAKLLLNRIRKALGARRQNWLQVFASFDHRGSGQLGELDFERAVTSMALGLSDQEIRNVRVYLQGTGNCLQVDKFGIALQACPDVLKVEQWARATLVDAAREAASAVRASGGVAPGATVKITGLQSVAGSKLNGVEGVVERWDAGSCRWVVRLSDGTCKAIQNDNLQVLRGAPARAPLATDSDVTDLDTASLYHLLCEDGETAVTEQRFLSIIHRMMPKLDDRQQRRLLLLQPKSPEGRVDVPELLSQLGAPPAGDQTLRLSSGGGLLPVQKRSSMPTAAQQRPMPCPEFRPTTGGPQPAWPGAGTKSALSVQSPTRLPASVPGAVPSPRAGSRPPGGLLSQTVGGSLSSAAPAFSLGDGVLLRLAQRLLARAGPGLPILRLFAARPEEIRLDELSAAVSVLPLGISRAEVQVLFEHLKEGCVVVSFDHLSYALESALAVGVPSEAAGLERVDLPRLAAALHRLGPPGKGGRSSPQQFRVTLMQAEPYMTPKQLEWLMMLTDKDGEGGLLPWSLLARLGGTPPANSGCALVPARVASGPHKVIAPSAPRSLVVTAILVRLRERLVAAGSQLDLERILCLFNIAAVGDDDATVSRDILVSLLSQLRLGISAAEAQELVAYVSGGRAGLTEGSVLLSAVFSAVRRAGETEAQSLIGQLRELGAQRLVGRGYAFAAAAAGFPDSGEWLAEADFRRCLEAALVDEASPQSSSATEEEVDRLLLLAAKNAAGDVRWKAFARMYLNLDGEDLSLEDRQWRSPGSMKTGNVRLDAPTSTQQSWRSLKAAQASSTQRSVVTPLGQVTEPESPRPRGFCRCRRRYGA